MFQRILTPIDLGSTHDVALRHVAKLANPKGAVTLIHVIELIHGLSRDEDRPFYERLERAARLHLEALVNRLREQGVQATALIRFGDPAQEIILEAREFAADVIILSSHPVDWNKPHQGFGTLSYKIGILGPCPVLLVK